ncbi:15182_t:CDS:2, partial [Racocetra persica]
DKEDQEDLENKNRTLKENQELGGKGGDKRIKQQVKNMLECMYLNSNSNSRDKLIAQWIYEKLQEFVLSRKIEQDDEVQRKSYRTCPKGTRRNLIKLFPQETEEKNNKTSTEIYAELVIGKGDQAVSLYIIDRWIATFKAEDEDIEDKLHSGHSCKITIPETIAKVKELVSDNFILLLEDWLTF